MTIIAYLVGYLLVGLAIGWLPDIGIEDKWWAVLLRILVIILWPLAIVVLSISIIISILIFIYKYAVYIIRFLKHHNNH